MTGGDHRDMLGWQIPSETKRVIGLEWLDGRPGEEAAFDISRSSHYRAINADNGNRTVMGGLNHPRSNDPGNHAGISRRGGRRCRRLHPCICG